MAQQLDTYAYPMDSLALQEKVIASFSSDKEAPTLYLPMQVSPKTNSLEEQEKMREEMEEVLSSEGFEYKKTLYKNNLDVNFMGLFKDHEKELAIVMKNIKTGPYHVLESSKDGFMISKGLLIYKGQTRGKEGTKLTVIELTEMKRDAQGLSVNWMNILNKRGAWFSNESGPISLEKSMKTAGPHKISEMKFFYYMDSQKFADWESVAASN